MRKGDHGGSVHPFLPRNLVREQLDMLSAADKARLFGLACDPAEDQCRQEFKLETDTAYQLAKAGAGQAFRVPRFGEVNDGDDLLSALEARRAYHEAVEALDPEARARVLRGDFKAPEPPAGGSGGGSGASPSPEGAAGG